MIVRELAFASQRDRALQVLGTITEANLPRSTDPIDYIGALAAIGQLDRARRLIEDDQLGYRVKLAGAWLETALRERARRRDRFGHPTVHHSMTRASTCTRPIGVEPSSTT